MIRNQPKQCTVDGSFEIRDQLTSWGCLLVEIPLFTTGGDRTIPGGDRLAGKWVAFNDPKKVAVGQKYGQTAPCGRIDSSHK